MVTARENKLITESGPGTPGGALMRRYWQPITLSRELPPGGAPQPLLILGERLVLFRDQKGRPGLLGINCSHRCADLSYGRIEDGGLLEEAAVGSDQECCVARSWGQRPNV